ncbi:MAG: hypothetical protein ACTHK4_01665 [Mycobacteriales bacterium]
MDAGDYLLGSIALSLGLLPWIPASRRLVRRIVPAWRGAEAALASSLVGVTGVVVVAELLGLVSGFRRWPFAITSAVVALAVARLGAPVSAAERRPARLPRERSALVMAGCVVVCVAGVSASFIARDAAVLHSGPLDVDSLHYHLTQAAQFVHTHSDVHLHHAASSDGTVYYPYDAELLDAVAMLGPHPDLAVFPLNLLFGWLALLACWVIGARWSAGAPALVAGAAILSLPIVAQASTGPGLNDVPAMAFVVAAVAALATAGVPRGDRPRGRWLAELAIAGLALGLAAGTKLDALPIAVLIAVAAVVAASGDRGRATLSLVGPAFLAGGFWYVRDWATVGSPVPDTNLTVAGHGFHVVPYPQVKPYAYTVAHYLGNGSVIRHWFVPGLRTVWTDLWPLVLVISAVGVLLAVFTERSFFHRALGVAAVLGAIVYVVTPTTAIGKEGAPLLFATNTRYVLPVVIVAAILFASASLLRRFALLVTIGFTAVVVALLAMGNLPQSVNYGWGVAGTVALAAATGLWRFTARAGGAARTPRLLLPTGLTVLVVAVGAVVQPSYLRNRYTGPQPFERLFAAVGSLEHQRIGVAGHGFEYPFFGRDFTNTVNYVGISAPSHAFDGPMSCPAMVTALTRLHDDYVVVEPLPVEQTARQAAWIAAIPGVREVFSTASGTVFKMPATISAAGCAGPAR